jgi:hypothetical protein
MEHEKLVLSNAIDKLRCDIEYLGSPERLGELAEMLDMSLPNEEPEIIVK